MYLIVWEFLVEEGRETEFEAVYGPEGEWVQLFRREEGYLGTELLRDETNPYRYLTLDRWVSATAYETFRKQWLDEYEALDRRCEGLAGQEVLLRVMVTVS